MKIFSKASQHVIRGMMYALETESLPSFSTKEVCVQVGIPEAYARKALREMTKAGILKGVPGPGGGYRFVREPSEISLLDIILAVDGPNAFAECPMGLRCQAQKKGEGFRSCQNCTIPKPKCGLSHLCPMHDLWKETRQVAIRHLQETTLQDIKDRLEGVLGETIA
jgi:Rrf2 family protein